MWRSLSITGLTRIVQWPIAQYKSKLDRIMNDYDLFKYISGLSGVGVCSTTGKTTMGEDAWERLVAAKPKQKIRLMQFRAEGFEHHIVCSQIAGAIKCTIFDGSELTQLSQVTPGRQVKARRLSVM
jgi:hypothetical protein